MIGSKTIATVALVSSLAVGTAFAQSNFARSHPGAYEAENPNRNLWYADAGRQDGS